jgi:hypothetical protein
MLPFYDMSGNLLHKLNGGAQGDGRLQNSQSVLTARM